MPIVLTGFIYSMGCANQVTTTNFIRRLDYFEPVSTSFIESRTYFDGLLRAVQENPQTGATRWTTTNRRYTWQGAPDVETLPYFASSPDFTSFPFLQQSSPLRTLRRTQTDWASRNLCRST